MQPFQLERYFAKYEFSAPYLLSPSDIEPLTMPTLLAMASDARKHQWENLRLGYTESQGHPDLLAAISTLYTEMKPQQIIETVPEEGIFIAMNTLLNAGDHLIVMHPGYQSLSEIAKSRGVDVTFWEPTGKWVFDVEMLASLRQNNTIMLVVNTPHNPTGYHFSQDEWQGVINFAESYDLWLFADEMYRFSEFDDNDRLPAACDCYKKAVSLSGLSKSFALPGLRVGWLATQNTEAMQRFIQFKDYTTICSSAPSEILAIIALEARQQILERNLGILQDNLTVLDQFFEKHSEHFSWVRPRAGTIGFVEYHDAQPVEELAGALVESKGLMIVPSSIFDYAGNYFRLGFGRLNMPESLALLADYVSGN